MRRHPEIRECFLMTGGSDYLLRVEVTNAGDFERIHKEILSTLPGVQRIHSSFSIRNVLATRAKAAQVRTLEAPVGQTHLTDRWQERLRCRRRSLRRWKTYPQTEKRGGRQRRVTLARRRLADRHRWRARRHALTSPLQVNGSPQVPRAALVSSRGQFGPRNDFLEAGHRSVVLSASEGLLSRRPQFEQSEA